MRQARSEGEQALRSIWAATAARAIRQQWQQPPFTDSPLGTLLLLA